MKVRKHQIRLCVYAHLLRFILLEFSGPIGFAKPGYRPNVIKLRQLPDYSTSRPRSLIARKSLISRRSFQSPSTFGPIEDPTEDRPSPRATKDFAEVIGRADSDGLRLTQNVARENFKETSRRRAPVKYSKNGDSAEAI